METFIIGLLVGAVALQYYILVRIAELELRIKETHDLCHHINQKLTSADTNTTSHPSSAAGPSLPSSKPNP